MYMIDLSALEMLGCCSSELVFPGANADRSANGERDVRPQRPRRHEQQRTFGAGLGFGESAVDDDASADEP